MFDKLSLIKFLLLFSFLSSCKENTSNDEKNIIKATNETISSSEVGEMENSKEETKNIEIEENYANLDEWVFSKCVSISNPQSCNENKYEDFKYRVSNDSVFINNNYTDKVISGELKSDVLYKKYGISKEFLFDKFNIGLPEKVKYIRNVKAYDSSSLLDNFFRDAFYIDKYMIFQYEGCVYCFKNVKVKAEKNTVNKINLPIASNTILNLKSSELNKVLFKDYSCGDNPKGFYLGKKDNYDIYIVSNDCGDFPYKDLISVQSNAIISKLNIEDDSWDIEKEENKKIRDENITSFSIDKDFKITIQTLNKINNKEKNKNISYFIVVNGKFIAK